MCSGGWELPRGYPPPPSPPRGLAKHGKWLRMGCRVRQNISNLPDTSLCNFKQLPSLKESRLRHHETIKPAISSAGFFIGVFREESAHCRVLCIKQRLYDQLFLFQRFLKIFDAGDVRLCLRMQCLQCILGLRIYRFEAGKHFAFDDR